MSKSSEDTFCSEQKLIFGDYTRRWACRATISRSTSPIYEMVLDGWCHRAPARPNNSIVEFICTTRLAAASALFARGSLSIKRSARCSWWRARTSVVRCRVPANAASVPALAGQQIDEVTVTYTPRHAIPKQRHATHRWPMHLQIAEEGTVCRGTCGLYGDGEHLVAAPRARLAPACLPHAQVPLKYHSHVSESLLMISECHLISSE